MTRMFKVAAIVAAGLAVASCGETDTSAPAAAAPFENTSYVVSAANPHAVKAGAAILEKGGSAVDAAIAVQAVLSLVEPQSSGLGGGAFMMHYAAEENMLRSYDGRETAPASATPDLFLDENGEPVGFLDAVVGGRSVGVPGVVAMMAMAHERHGRLPWAELFDPAIALSEDGFAISPRMNNMIGRLNRLAQMPAAQDYLYNEEGEPWPVGHILKNPAYAETLRLLAADGPDVFYTGKVAEQIVAAATGTDVNPSGMTLEDFKAYEPLEREPVCGDYRGYTVCSMGPPSSGGVTVLQILGLIEPFDIAAMGALTPEASHLIVEASRLAYADRGLYLADSDFVEAPISGLLNPEYLTERSGLIRLDAVMEEALAGDPTPFMGEPELDLAPDESPELPSTSHFTVIDGAGDVVSMTTTVEFPFGSHLFAGGFVLNNQLTDFSFVPERNGRPVANAVAPGKRPRSSMSPVIVFDENGEFYAALGSPGGPAIIGFVAKTLIALIDWEMDMQAAIDLPNIVFARGRAAVEKDAFSVETTEALRAMGHDVIEFNLGSGVHGARVTADGYDAGADKRREGEALVVDKSKE